MNRWVRKGNIVAAGVAAVLLSIFLFFFMDPILKWGFKKAGRAAAGAKVDIASVKTSVFRGRLALRGVAVADKSEPMKNLFQFDEAVFEFSPKEALRAKIVIPKASITGLRFGTKRKKSGAIRGAAGKPSALERAVNKELAGAGSLALDKLGQAAPAKPEIDPKKLQSLAALDQAKGRLAELEKKWKGKIDPAKYEARVKALQEKAKAIRGGGSPAEIAKSVKTLQDIQKDSRQLLQDIDAQRGALKTEFDSVQEELKKAESLKSKDVNGLLAAAGLPTLDSESLARHLLGPQAARKLSTALYWIAWARKHAAASSKDKTAEPPERRRGVNVEFPLKDSTPQFLLEQAELAGAAPSPLGGADMAISGAVGGVNSNPPLYGRPATLTLTGQTAGGGPSMDLRGLLDQTRKPDSAELSFHYAGLPVAGLELGDGQLGAQLEQGTARLSGTAKIIGGEWKGEVLAQVDGAKLLPKIGTSGPETRYVQAALSGIKRFSATITFEGKENDLHFHVASDLGQAVSDGLKKGVSSQLLAQKKALQDQLEALYSGKAKGVSSDSGRLQSSLLGPLDQQKGALQNILQQSAPKGLNVPGLNKLFGR